MTEQEPTPKKKKSMIVNLLIGFVVLVAALVIFVATRPDEFRISRSESIDTPPEVPFDYVNDLRKWDAWSPWEQMDPAMKKTLEGPPAGVGAISRWDGNDQVGAGSNTIVESQPNELIRFKLEMLRPFKDTNDVSFTFKPEANQTRVTWSMVGKLNFITKAVHLVMNIDKMVGAQFEKGLSQLKTAAEAESKVESESK